MTTNWRDRAACQGEDVTIFFPDTRGVEASTNPAATAICDRCPVRRECLESELSKSPALQFGWFGGKSPSEREAIIRKRKRTRGAAA
jgi:hypothetical protein